MTETSSAVELAELRSSVRDFLAAKSGEQQVRAAIETKRGYDEDLWRDMASQLGLAALALPEKYGGDGFGFTELQVVLEELGRALTPSPFFASVVLAAGAILAAGDEAAAQAYLPGIASGQTTAALAVTESAGLWSFGQLAATARPAGDGDGWRLATIVGCVYPDRSQVFVKKGDEFRPAAFLLGKKVKAAAETTCQPAQPQVANAN